MKRIIAILILFALLPVSSLADHAPHKLEQRSVPVYCTSSNDYRDAADMILISDFPLYYVDGVNDLPYVDLSDFMKIVNAVDTYDTCDPFGEPSEPKEDYILLIDESQGIITCTYQPQNSDLIIDFTQGTLTYTCMDTFGKDPAYGPYELQTNQLDFLQRIYDPKLSRLGSAKTISLKDYGIPMLVHEGKYLLPLHTAFDFLVWVPKIPWKILCCNGAAIFIGDRVTMFGYSDAPSELGEIYFSRQPAKRSAELAKYGYNELCLLLDSFYGLKEPHHIDSFRGFFKANGYEEKLLSEDPNEADQVLSDVIQFSLDDFHSNFSFPSWMSGKDAAITYAGSGFSRTLDANKEAAFVKAFSESPLNDEDFYTESGNTAYLTLSRMHSSVSSEQFYSMDPDDKSVIGSDAVTQILYADRQINRENSPIENVVLDLSRNPGGDVNTPACVLSWFLGEGYMTIANSFTGGFGIGKYKADINRDHQFTAEDSLRGKKKLFCLISPLTFSSANMTAAMMKSSGAVTMIGQTTRGGSGIVTPAVTGWDSVFVISGFKTVVTVKNGSWYDADQGVSPDVYLADPAAFYDRERLTEIINGIQ